MSVIGDTLGTRLAVSLYSRDMTQENLAEMTGISAATISRYLNDRMEPKASQLRKMAVALGVSADYLLGIKRKRKKDE